MLTRSRSSAKQRGLEFNLTIEDIVIPTYCPYLGVELTRSVGKGRIWTNASIDRINNKIGYLKGNVQVISYLANAMKRDLSIDQLLVFAHNIIKTHSK